ncbi:T9SS type A sorting domain-containing protein [Pontibacter harenae]|uniref:T9SS type A sorting domain-containing protein n=1 Tax=Pontibacter harenae TaxID=2894083 RepID=UPI001E3D5478|nr:T9SS type A sorting domain-containing protein [Pontibacter harenae]MCC9166884.1 T9SS type A sorting domain-containing protein [Pontibacter harenae]
MKKALAVIFVVLTCSVGAWAQVVLQPLQQEVRQVERNAAVALRQSAAPVSLPFFGDFANSDVSPDPERWLNGGVFINNRYGLNPITINVATMDGLNAQGRPYVPGSLTAGPSDTLTSQPFLLSVLSPSDSVYLSFYWQSGGMGEVPSRNANNTIYLVLEFKNASGAWQEVWRQNAVGEVTEFAQVFVGLKDSRFFHNDFQFRFRNIGLRNGLADTWNLDYVVLDRNRRKGQNRTTDIAISKNVSKLLKDYTAMPRWQFVEAPEEALAEEVTATLNNLGSVPGAISWRGFLEVAGAAIADTFLRAQGLIPGGSRQYEISGAPSLTNIGLPAENFVLRHSMVLITNEQNPLLRANDTTYRETEIANYYAYDDGTAEAGFNYIATGASQVAQRFDLNKPDQVRAFRVHFPRVRNNLSNTSVTFRVWEDANGIPGEILHQQAFQVQYSETLNGFYEVELSRAVPVQGAFYIGWSQPGSLFINMGFDKNEPMVDRRFVWSSVNGWQTDNFTQGAIMMRPVMTGETVLGLDDDQLEKEGYLIYPNPSTGKVYVSGEYERLQVYDLAGRLVHEQSYKRGTEPVNLEHLSSGLYNVRIEKNKFVTIKKLILSKP